MALTRLEQDTLSKGMGAARLIIEQLKPIIDGLNILYDSAGGVKETLTQADLDTVANYSGLTKQQVDDGMYVLTATLRDGVNNAYTQLLHLAARG